MRRALYPIFFPAWTPRRLGPKLLAWFDAERTDLITIAGGNVSSFKDVVGAYDAVQGTEANQPNHGLASFNGRPGITPNGTSDELTRASTTGLPTGTTPFEAWLICDQTVAAADNGVRAWACWGGQTAATRFDIRRIVSGGVNRAAAGIGDNSGITVVSNGTVDFSGRHVVRVVCDGVNARVDVDGVAGTPTAVAHNFGTTNFRLFARNDASPALYCNGVFSALPITRLLDSTQAVQMLAYCNRRL